MDSILPGVNEAMFGDLDRELTVTRTVLERLPQEHYGWKPHEKSMTLIRLAMHVAELVRWANDALAVDELDAATMPPQPAEAKHTNELLAIFDKNAAELRQTVAGFDPEDLNANWTMRNGSQIMVTRPRAMVYRVWSINHLIHHRGQLCLYLRLLNIPVPTVYFNTADDPTWVFE
jgi:uncharacterized damage-inducible protein DinB